MTKFKIGDHVERINTRWVSDNSHRIMPGDKGFVTRIVSDTGIDVSFGRGVYQTNGSAKNYRLIPQEIAVGSRVACDNYAGRGETMYGTITRLDRAFAYATDWTIGTPDGAIYRDRLRLARPDEQTPNDLTETPARPATTEPTGTYIVVLAEDGVLKPNHEPHIHFTAAAAKKEAHRLAEKHGGTFLVMAACWRYETKKIVTYDVTETSI